jgi:hypothetical protein
MSYNHFLPNKTHFTMILAHSCMYETGNSSFEAGAQLYISAFQSFIYTERIACVQCSTLADMTGANGGHGSSCGHKT